MEILLAICNISILKISRANNFIFLSRSKQQFDTLVSASTG